LEYFNGDFNGAVGKQTTSTAGIEEFKKTAIHKKGDIKMEGKVRVERTERDWPNEEETALFSL
jgi:hypothetical protein